MCSAPGLYRSRSSKPQSVEEVQHCAKLCNAAGAPMIPHGGGLSYTDGYLYRGQGAVLFDLRALNRIVTIADDEVVLADGTLLGVGAHGGKAEAPAFED
jgi:FAD/FMN-containing dehydrogenase